MTRLFAYEVEQKPPHTPGNGDDTFSLFLELADDGRLRVKLAFLTTSSGRHWREHFRRQSEADCLELSVCLPPARAAALAESIERAYPKQTALSWAYERLRRLKGIYVVGAVLLLSMLVFSGGQ